MSNDKEAISLLEYIDKHFNGSKREFAEAQGIKPQQVTRWLNNEFIVVGNILYSERRELVAAVNKLKS